jgi:hypothetical protein
MVLALSLMYEVALRAGLDYKEEEVHRSTILGEWSNEWLTKWILHQADCAKDFPVRISKINEK